MNLKRNLAGLGALLFAASAVAQTNYTPLFQFAIFYNGLLEFTWCAPMTVNGLTHANGNIYTGSQSQLTFNGLVTTTGTVSSPAWDGKPPANTPSPPFTTPTTARTAIPDAAHRQHQCPRDYRHAAQW